MESDIYASRTNSLKSAIISVHNEDRTIWHNNLLSDHSYSLLEFWVLIFLYLDLSILLQQYVSIRSSMTTRLLYISDMDDITISGIAGVPQGCTHAPSSTTRKRIGRPPKASPTKATLDQRKRRQKKMIHKEAGNEIIASKASVAQQKRRQQEKQRDALTNLSTNNGTEPNDVPAMRCCISQSHGRIANDTTSTTSRGNNVAQTNRQPLSDITLFHPNSDEFGIRYNCPITITPNAKENTRNHPDKMHVSRKGKEKESERHALQYSFVRRRNTGVVICEGGRKDDNHASRVTQNETPRCSGKGKQRQWQAVRGDMANKLKFFNATKMCVRGNRNKVIVHKNGRSNYNCIDTTSLYNMMKTWTMCFCMPRVSSFSVFFNRSSDFPNRRLNQCLLVVIASHYTKCWTFTGRLQAKWNVGGCWLVGGLYKRIGRPQFIYKTQIMAGIKCRLGVQTAMVTAWTKENPGRRFWGCPNGSPQNGGCGFFGTWFDPPMCDRSKEIVPGLLSKCNRLEGELKKLRKKA